MGKVKKKKPKWYAVKAIDGKEVNEILTTWDECKRKVEHHASVYKSFFTVEEAKQYLNDMTDEKQKAYLEQAKVMMELKRTKPPKKKVRKLTITIADELCQKFENRLKKMNYKADDVMLSFIEEWVSDDYEDD